MVGGDGKRWFPGDSEVARRMRELDWSQTEVGAPEQWPESLGVAVGLCLTSLQPTIVWWGASFAMFYNDACLPWLGSADHAQVLGRSARGSSELWPLLAPSLERVRATGRAITTEVAWDQRSIELSLGALLARDGRVDGIFAPCRDLTSQRASARQMELLHHLAIQTTSRRSVDGVCGEALHLLAKHAADVPFAAIYLCDESALSARLVGATTNEGDLPASVALSERGRASLAGLGAPRTAVPIHAPGHDGIEGLLVAQADPRLLESIAALLGSAFAAAHAYEVEAQRAEMLADVDRVKTAFFSNISHEFRTPLTLVLGPLREALARADQSLVGDELRSVDRNARRLMKLVNSLLDFSRLEVGVIEGSFVRTDLSALTTELATTFRSMIETAGLELVIDCPTLSRAVEIDRDAWEKIVLNLVSNACKFTLEGSVSVSVREVGGAAQLIVRDTGAGIDVAHLPQLFERFHRSDAGVSRSQESAGIGLAMVQELVRMHGGKIDVESTLGIGSAFIVTVPFEERRRGPGSAKGHGAPERSFVDEASEWMQKSTRIDRRAASPSERIVVADDNSDMRAYFARLLGRRWKVETTVDGESALAAIRRDRPALVITDAVMPGLDGFELIRKLRRDTNLRTIPVIMVSARAGEEAQIEGLGAGADDYLVKPFTGRELVARVAARLELNRLGRDLEQQRSAISQLFAHCPVPVAMLTGPELVYVNANPAYMESCERVGGDAGRPVQGRTMREVMPEVESKWGDLLRQVLRTGIPHVDRDVKLEFERDGVLHESYWTYIFSPLKGAGDAEDVVVVITSETTDQMVAAQCLEQMAAEANAANRTKDEFLAMLGHELRNPLSPILTSLQVLRLRGIDSQEQRIIERQVCHLTRLVDDLLDVSRITRGKVELRKERIELGTVISRAVEMTTPLLEQRRHLLTLEVPPIDLIVEADADRLAQVFSNLLTNAAKYTAEDGKILVRVEHGDGRVRVRIVDNGAGIAEEMLARVFELFTQQTQTLDRAEGGLGLGLAIVKSLVELHGGTVSAYSSGPGQGSEFMVELPLLAAHVDIAVTAVHAHPMSPTSLSRILVVDDNDDAAYALKKALEVLGHTVETAHDGPDALRRVTSFKPNIALVDIGLPVMDGYELARRLREQQPVHLVAVTGYGQESDFRRSAAAGFEQHLVKPVDLDRLQEVVNLLNHSAGA
ncbi:MAG: Chemotaxis protein methyltransferase CheR [Myxococcales bacterium]|nr:Chemotaxis protein methyltransferase CheR [Myxococcales bacterium]